VSSNIVNLNNDSRFMALAGGTQVYPYAIIDSDGSGTANARVAYVGTMAPGVNDMFGNPMLINSTVELTALRNTVAQLQNLGVNKIVASVSGPNVVNAIVEEVPGIDVIIVVSELYQTNVASAAGPYPTVREMPWHQPVLIVGTGINNGKYLGRLNLVFDDWGVIKSWSGAPILLNDASPIDSAMQDDIITRQVVVDSMSDKVVGQSTVELGFEHNCMFGECTLGSWSTDVMREVTGAQVGLYNGGSMYAAIPAGNITLGALRTALPFQNSELRTYKLEGKYLWEAMENSFLLVTNTSLNINQGIGRFLQVSGMRLLYNPLEQFGWRIVDISIETSLGVWEPIDLAKDYNVVSFSWLSGIGGDGYTMVRDNVKELKNTGFTSGTVWITSLGQKPLTNVETGRLNATSLTQRTCLADDGQLCSGNGQCRLGVCHCTVEGAAGPVCSLDSQSASSGSSDGLTSGAIAGIVVGVSVGGLCILLLAIIVTAVLASLRKRPEEQEWMIDFDELEIADLLGRGGKTSSLPCSLLPLSLSLACVYVSVCVRSNMGSVVIC
jgi:2',3'-cyclic-nucleotide 2'-phosphodiesterase (5'-nucleotidase family)